MAWFRGCDKSHNNRKLLAVGLVGTGLHWRAVSWSAGEESDGVVPAAVVPSLSPELSSKARADLVNKMVLEGLWIEDEGAYHINDFLTFNPSHADLESKREAEKKRIAAKRC